MEVIPAIDIKGGRCVRLVQGDFDQEQVFGEDPVAMGKYWQQKGAHRLHVVDLDGARDGKPVNLSLITDLIQSLDIPVQLGGGIRSLDIINKYLDIGLERVIVGTMAIKKPEIVTEALDIYGADRIVIGVDARDGLVAVSGWLEKSKSKVEDIVSFWKNKGAHTFIYTDISRDGMLSGPDLKGLKKLLALGSIEVIASGGISSITDLKELDTIGVNYAIVGQALYTGELDVNQL